jgi:solute carrier family 25 2-oxodicarboxylate transporter 21
MQCINSCRMVEILVMYPTDVAKTRAQLASSQGEISQCFLRQLYTPHAHTAGRNMFSMLASMVRNEGIASLYRGIASPIVAEAPKRAVKFASNEQYMALLTDRNGMI